MTRRLRIAAVLTALLTLSAGAASFAQAQTDTAGQDPIFAAQTALVDRRLHDAEVGFKKAIDQGFQVPRATRGLADVARVERRWADAQKYYAEAIRLYRETENREDAESHAGLGMVYVRLGRIQDATAEFQPALQADPENWTATYGQARVLISNKLLDQAKTLLDRGAGRQGIAQGEQDYHFGLSLYYLAANNAYEAEQEALRALYVDWWDLEIIDTAVRLTMLHGDNNTAITLLEQVAMRVGNRASAPLLSELGRLYQVEKRYDDARKRYINAVAADSTYTPALRNLADLLALGKQYVPAARIYLRYLSIEPKDVDALLGMSRVMIELGQYDIAAKHARSALAIASSRPDVRRTFIRASLRASDPAARATAAAAFKNMAADTSWTADDWISLSEYQRSQKDFVAAGASLDRAAKISPDSPAVVFGRAMIELSAGRQAAAIELFQKAIKMSPADPTYHLNLGIAYLGLRRNAEGLASMRQAVAVDEKYTIGRLLLAQTLAAMDSTVASDAQYKAILGYDPKNGRALRGLGLSCLRRAKYAEAIQYYRTSTEVDPNSADGWAGLGSAAVGANDLATAQQALDKAKAIDPQNVNVKKGLELLARARGESGQSE